MAYAWLDSLPRGGLEGPGWHKVVPPILRSTPLVDAPGHNTLTFAPNNVDYITAYHARVVPFVGPGDRQTFVDRVYWNHDRPFMEQPTTARLALPGQPLFSAPLLELEYGVKAWWTAEFYLEGQSRQGDNPQILVVQGQASGLDSAGLNGW